MIASILACLFILFLFLNIAAVVLKIGKERKPITAPEAVAVFIVDTFFALIVAYIAWG